MNQFVSNGNFLDEFCGEHEPEGKVTSDPENDQQEPSSPGTAPRKAPMIFVINPMSDEKLLGKRSHKSSCAKSSKDSEDRKADQVAHSDSESDDEGLMKSNLENLLAGMAAPAKKLKD